MLEKKSVLNKSELFKRANYTFFVCVKTQRKTLVTKHRLIQYIPLCETHHTPTQHTHNEYIIKSGHYIFTLNYHPN